MLNKDLIKKQGLSEQDVEALELLHNQKYKLYDKHLEDININEYIALMETLEFRAQTLWKFKQDSSYHRWWLTDPKCSCAIQDNIERIPYGRIYSGGCKLHGENSG